MFGNALKWSYVMDIGRQVLTMAVTAVLAGLLGPAAFGMVAMAAVYILFVEMLLQQGIVAAIIQRQDLEDDHLDAAFWLTMASGLCLLSASIALSGWWSEINQTPELAGVINWLSLLVPLKSLTVVQEAVLRRRMDFRSLAIRTNVAEVVGGVVGIAAALAGYGVWALVAQQVVRRVVEAVVLWALSDWRPAWRFRPRAATDILGFSTGAFLSSVAVFVNNRADALLIGIFFGPVAVGLYRFGLRFVDLLIGSTVRSLSAVSLPELSRLQADGERFSARLRTLVHLGAVLAIPVMGVLAGSASTIMRLVGEDWAPAVRPLQILCVVGVVRVLIVFAGPMLQAQGRPFLQASMSWLVAGVSAATFVVAGVALQSSTTASQVVGVAASRAVIYGGAVLVLTVWLMSRFGGVEPLLFLRVATPAIASGLAAMVAGSAVAGALLSWSAFLAAPVVGVAATAVALATLLVLDSQARDLVLVHALPRLTRGRQRRRSEAASDSMPAPEAGRVPR